MNSKRKWWEVDSAMLHIMAMVFMLCDHAWSTLFSEHYWMTCVGRIAFPIYAFLTVEGFFHTKNFKKYMLRMLICALLSEIPFNLMMGGWIDPFDQNVIWTFIIALLAMKLLETIKNKLWHKNWLFKVITLGLAVLIVMLCYALGMITFVDYHGEGILMVFVFFFFRQRKWWSYLAQLALMYYINVPMLGSRYDTYSLFGVSFDFYYQSIALLALIPIWLYKGKQGYHSKAFQYCYYAFYPVHILVLVGIGYLLQ